MPFFLYKCIILDILDYDYDRSPLPTKTAILLPLAQQARLKDDLLDPVDQLLEDPALVDWSA